MRASLRMCALALAFVLATVAVIPPARADMDKPTWNAGDYWVYTSTDVGFGFSGPGTVRYDVLGPDTVNVAGADYPSYRLKVTANGTSSPYANVAFNSADAWYRTADLALVKQSWNLTADVIIIGRVDVVVTITFDPPLGLGWPFAPGRTWSATSRITTVTTLGGLPPGTNTDAANRSFEVRPSATVTVAAGTFDTTPVRARETGTGDYSDASWSPQAGNTARETTYDSAGNEIDSKELTSYRYAGSGFLGLPVIVWLLIILIVFLVVLGIVFLRRQRRRGVMVPQTPPPQMPQ